MTHRKLTGTRDGSVLRLISYTHTYTTHTTTIHPFALYSPLTSVIYFSSISPGKRVGTESPIRHSRKAST